MNLHGIVSSIISVVNQPFPVAVQISIGDAVGSDGTPTPAYATPGNLTASIGGAFDGFTTGNVLTVTSVLAGSLWPTDFVSGTDGDGNTLPANTTILSQLSGTLGGVGTYQMSGTGTPGDLSTCVVTSLSTVLNVSAVPSGVVQVGQALSDGSGALLAGPTITELGSGSGGPGTYIINQPQTVALEPMATSLTMLAQVQPMTFRDLQQVDALNLQGTKWKVYLYGEVDGLVRVEKKGGDLVTISSGRHQGVWLVTQVLEQWPDWVCAAITLQDGA